MFIIEMGGGLERTTSLTISARETEICACCCLISASDCSNCAVFTLNVWFSCFVASAF